MGTKAQHVPFSQYYFTPQQFNPGVIALDRDHITLQSIHRQQSTNVGVNLNTTAISVSYPITYIKDRSFGGINLLALRDKNGEGGFFRNNELGLGYNQILAIQKDQFLSVGIQTRYVNKRFSLEDFTTGSQFIPGQGFDPIFGNGEPLDGFKNNFLTWNVGAYWHGEGISGEQKFFAGIAAYHLNQPK